LIKNDEHINELLRQKFENFEPAPPMKVWESIEKELDAKPGFFTGKSKFYAPILLAFALIPVAYFSFFAGSTSIKLANESKQILNNEVTIIADASRIVTNENLEENNRIQESANNTTEKLKPLNEIDADFVQTSTNTNIADNKTLEFNKSNLNQTENILKEPTTQTKLEKNNKTEHFGLFKLDDGFAVQTNKHNIASLIALNINNISLNSFGQAYSISNTDVFKDVSSKKKHKTGHWENTIFLSPEFSLNNLDSVTILNSYSIGVEPSKYFNDNLFIRFGLNLSFSGDKGFAKIDYRSNELMGTYDDVYNVTFDTLGGNVTPIYHTKTVEVWDSIQKIGISEVTNRYLFANLPVLLGYKNKIGNLNWYVYGGPAIGFQVSKWIDEPSINGEDITILNLDNKLPLRSSINYQLWLGAGVEYKLSNKYSIVLEPSYKYYFKSLYNDENYKFNTSAFAFRLGFNYKIEY
jgi:hypothetical protein